MILTSTRQAPAQRCRPDRRRSPCRRTCAPVQTCTARTMPELQTQNGNQEGCKCTARSPSTSRCAACRCWCRREACTGPRLTEQEEQPPSGAGWNAAWCTGHSLHALKGLAKRRHSQEATGWLRRRRFGSGRSNSRLQTATSLYAPDPTNLGLPRLSSDHVSCSS